MLFTRNKDTVEFIQKFIQYLGPFVQGSDCFRLRNSWSFCYAFQNRQSSTPAATFFQNRDTEQKKRKALCTEQKTDFSLLPCSHTHFQIDEDGHSEGSFMGRERTSFPKAVILHLSIRVGDSRPFLNPLQELREKRFCCQHVRLFIWVI